MRPNIFSRAQPVCQCEILNLIDTVPFGFSAASRSDRPNHGCSRMHAHKRNHLHNCKESLHYTYIHRGLRKPPLNRRQLQPDL